MTMIIFKSKIFRSFKFLDQIYGFPVKQMDLTLKIYYSSSSEILLRHNKYNTSKMVILQMAAGWCVKTQRSNVNEVVKNALRLRYFEHIFLGIHRVHTIFALFVL